MIKDLLISFKDNIKTKTSNPFFGALILVWITKNWNLIYSIFNFDTKTTLEDKRNFIINHFTTRPFIETLLWCVLETFIIILISYILVNLARLIVNFFDKQVTPIVYKWTDEKSIVLKSVFDASENERKRLERRVEEEREAKLKLQEDYDKLEKRIAELLTEKNTTKTNVDDEKKTKTTKQKVSQTPNEEKLTLLYNKLQKDNKIESFERVASTILNDIPMEKTHEVTEFTTLGLIAPGNYTNNNRYKFSLTPIGKEIQEKLLMEKLR
jgi:hypothetical protein